jgi:hypothetical protein
MAGVSILVGYVWTAISIISVVNSGFQAFWLAVWLVNLRHYLPERFFFQNCCRIFISFINQLWENTKGCNTITWLIVTRKNEAKNVGKPFDNYNLLTSNLQTYIYSYEFRKCDKLQFPSMFSRTSWSQTTLTFLQRFQFSCLYRAWSLYL